MAGLSAQGLGSGLDINSLVKQLVASERAGAEGRIKRIESRVDAQITATGTVRGALSALQTSLAGLKTETVFQGRKAESSDKAVFSASADASSVAGSYSVEVTERASAHKLASGVYSEGRAHRLGAGTLSFSQGETSFSVTLPADADSLEDLRDGINSAAGNTGVQATIINEKNGSRLVLTSRLTGADNAMSVSTTGGALHGFGYTAGSQGGLTEVAAARDASLLVDGFEVSSASNSVVGAIEGVTLDLLAAKPGTPLTLTVGNDTTAARDRVVKFIADFNVLGNTIARLRSYDPATRVGGPLVGDAMLRNIEGSLRREAAAASATASAPYDSLSSIGVSFGADGTLKLDEAKLTAALSADYGSVGRLFGSAEGVAARLSTVVEGAIGAEGRVTQRSETLTATKRAATRDREALELRMVAVEKRYRAQFSALDSLLSGMQSTSGFLAQRLG